MDVLAKSSYSFKKKKIMSPPPPHTCLVFVLLTITPAEVSTADWSTLVWFRVNFE